MKRKGHTPDQIVKKLRQADAKLAEGLKMDQVCKEIGVSDATYYKWRKEYGPMQVDQVKQLKQLQKENTRLKKLVADLSLDKAILKEALSGNY
jgi:transposase-like protein